jgi:hypothetical protein
MAASLRSRARFLTERKSLLGPTGIAERAASYRFKLGRIEGRRSGHPALHSREPLPRTPGITAVPTR